jgi:hypothetical protein
MMGQLCKDADGWLCGNDRAGYRCGHRTRREAVECRAWARAQRIEELAAECARQAIEQGAAGPWDGDMLPGDLQALAKLIGKKPNDDQLQTFERVFCRTVEDINAL